MLNRTLLITLSTLFTVILAAVATAQSRQPYTNAVTDQLVRPETPMPPPLRNVVFTDPDFGSSMVRATDAGTNFKGPGTFLRTEGSGHANEWSEDTSKFYVAGRDG